MTEEFAVDVAQYVGANEDLDFEKYADDLRPYLRSHKTLYRLWSEVDSDHVEQRLRNAKVLATSNSIDAIQLIAENTNQAPGTLITTHSGVGIMPVDILKDALARDVIITEKSYVKRVIVDNEYQQEVLLLQAAKEFSYYGMWMGDGIEKF